MPPPHHAKHDQRALAALFAVFALMVQALIPSAALAARQDPAGAMTICTANGTQTIATDGKLATPQKQDSHRGFGGMPCQDCLAAAMAMVVTASITIEPVGYQVARADHVLVFRVLAPRARAPPRPPGQGPPTA